jgi:hypothetical protein
MRTFLIDDPNPEEKSSIKFEPAASSDVLSHISLCHCHQQ